MSDIVFIVVFSILALLFLFLFFVVIITFSHAILAVFSWPPPIPTDRKTLAIAIKKIQEKYSSDFRIKVVDPGCGYGRVIFKIAKLFPRAEVTGIDILYPAYYYSKL